MEIKVCGNTSVEQLSALQGIGVNYAGIILYEGSKRFAGEKLRGQKEAIESLDISCVGVFVDDSADYIINAIEEYSLMGVQLHGSETPEFCHSLMGKANVIKAFHIDNDTDIDAMVAPYQDSCNYYLFDTASEEGGGSGRKFDWDFLDKALVNKLFFLSGGIGPDDADRISSFYHPFLYAIDINSRFETSPGVKDIQLIHDFITSISGKTTDPEVTISLNT
jgi:phosphoribosylanthranilate isomerase